MSDYVSSDRFLDVGDVLSVLEASPRTAPVELVDMQTGLTTPILAVLFSAGGESDGVDRVYVYTEEL